MHDIIAQKKDISRIGMAYFLWLLIITIASAVISVVLYLYYPDVFEYSWFSIVASMIIMYILGAPVCILMLKKSEPVVLYKFTIKPKEWFNFFLISIFLMYVGNIIGVFLMTVISVSTGEVMENPLMDLFTDGNLALNIFFAVIAAPVLEEMMFRKLLIDRLAKYGQKTAIVISALLFGLFHGNLYQFFYAFALGLVFGYVYSKYGKIQYTMLLHFSINALGGIIAPLVLKASGMLDFYLSSSEDASDIIQYLSPRIIILIIYVITMFSLALAGLVMLILKRKQITFFAAPEFIKSEKKISVIIFNPGMILVIAFGIVTTIMTAFDLPTLSEFLLSVL